MSDLSLPRHKAPALGVSMKLAREMREKYKNDVFAEPNNGVIRPPVFEGYAAIACFGNEPPPAGWVEITSSDFGARIFVPKK